MGLSKGTLGLKFMNRQAPVAVSPSPAADPPPSSSASTAPAPPARVASGRSSEPAKSTKSSTSASRTATGPAPPAQHDAPPPTQNAIDRHDWNQTSARASRPTVVHETSLLSFPLLSTLNRSSVSAAAGPSNSSGSMTATYSSMPLTSAMVSGRRSFGGANIEIEKLNDPSSHQAPPEGTDSAQSKSAKRPKKADRDAALVGSVRREAKNSSTRGGLSGSGAGKRAADLDRRGEGAGGDDATKKRRKTDETGVMPRWEVDDDQVSTESGGEGGAHAASTATARSSKSVSPAVGGNKAEFARPAGFEGVKKKMASNSIGPAASKSGSKGKNRSNAADLMDDQQYRWAKPGETREWDAGKSSEDESEDEGDSSEGSDDEEEMVSGSSDAEGDQRIAEEEKRFSEAADRAVGGGGGRGTGGGSKGGRQKGSKNFQGGQRRR